MTLRLLLLSIASACLACATAPKTEEGRTDLREQADQVLAKVEQGNPVVSRSLDEAHGYVVFPEVGKGGAGVGGAYGRGVVYEQGEVVGYADLKQVSVGLQLGGQTYSEIVLFEDAEAMQELKENGFSLDSNASAVAVEAGAGASVMFRNGVAVFTLDRQGLMYEATVAGQKFDFVPL